MPVVYIAEAKQLTGGNGFALSIEKQSQSRPNELWRVVFKKGRSGKQKKAGWSLNRPFKLYRAHQRLRSARRYSLSR